MESAGAAMSVLLHDRLRFLLRALRGDYPQVESIRMGMGAFTLTGATPVPSVHSSTTEQFSMRVSELQYRGTGHKSYMEPRGWRPLNARCIDEINAICEYLTNNKYMQVKDITP